MRAILKLFGRSPFGPTVEHMRRVTACVGQLSDLIDAVIAGDQERLAKVVAVIDELEADCDEAKHEIRDHLPRAVFLPVDRRDLLEVVHHQDSIADSLQEAASLISLKPLPVPESLRGELLAFCADVLEAVQAAALIMERMDELVEATFEGPEAARVLELINDLSRAEGKSEMRARELARTLFILEGEMSPVDIMLWYQVVQKIAAIANYAERTANRLRLLIARS